MSKTRAVKQVIKRPKVKDVVRDRVREYFTGSSDFNGILLFTLCAEFGMTWPKMRRTVGQLVRSGEISLAFASHSINPHIKRLPDLPVEEQLSKLAAEDPYTVCAYPSPEVIRVAADLSAYDSRPFTKRLALGEPHLTPVYFDFEVLDRYYRDPRYRFDFHDFGGTIGITTEHYESPNMADRDKVLLQSFGIGYDSNHERVAVVFLRYLADLSPEHQQIWAAHVVIDACNMNSDYLRTTIYGDWSMYYSVYQAFLTELAEINKLSGVMGKPVLFRDTFEDNRPEGFHTMLRPTRKNFDEFIHLLDKMLSENINRDFFKGDIPLERQVPRDEGTVEIQRPETIQLLEEWLRTRYRTSDGEDVSREVLEPLKEVRKLRQKPAHALRDNEYDRSYPKQQDDILGRACRALTQLRVIFWSHPRARERYSPPNWLDGDNIVFY
jgi:hypothetical protein